MSFLTLNGLAVEVRDAGDSVYEPIEVGLDYTRGLSGRPWHTARAVKNKWKFETVPMVEANAVALVRMLLGQGHTFPFDTDLLSSGGLSPTTSVYELIKGIAADLQPITNAVKFGANIAGGALAVEAAATNMLSSNVATGTDTSANTTGFTAIDLATIATSTAAFFQGARSLSVISTLTTNGTLAGVKTNAVAASAATHYVGSVYVRAAVGSPSLGFAVRAYLNDEVNAIAGPVSTITLTANWQRIPDLTLTTGAGSPTISLYVTENVDASNITFYCDGFQLETGDVSTQWVNGTRAGAGLLKYSTGLVSGLTDLTINTWIKLPVQATTRYLVHVLGNDLGSAVRNTLRFSSASSLINFTTNGNVPSSSNIISSGALNRNQWYMVTAVLRRNPRSGQPAKELWVDGVLVASSLLTTHLPDLSTATGVSVGSFFTAANPWHGGAIDDLMLLPYAVSSVQIASWAASGIPQTLPRLIAAGDFLAGVPSILVRAVPKTVAYIPHASGSTFVENSGRVEFELEAL